MSGQVLPFARRGQRCGVCAHFQATGETGRWKSHVCAVSLANGKPFSLPVVEESGTKCPKFKPCGSGRSGGSR